MKPKAHRTIVSPHDYTINSEVHRLRAVCDRHARYIETLEDEILRLRSRLGIRPFVP